MIKNNIISLIVHMLVSVLIWFTAGFITDLLIKLSVSETITNVIYIVTSILGWFLYYKIGSKLLVSQKNVLKDFLSVSSVLIAALLIWCYCFFFTDGGWAWMILGIYNASNYPISSVLITNEVNLIWVSFIPSILLWISMINRKHQKENFTTNH
ncbi:hypothetical protein AB1282_20030 [Gottfriedia sp. S16(2024)]|uniref:hypothetical protein n=1 Tax=Gottfriedia sp. S16(2024) TaxID=3162883 RepID=UPI003D24C38C